MGKVNGREKVRVIVKARKGIMKGEDEGESEG